MVSLCCPILALFLKKVISKCPSNDFLHLDLQFAVLIVMLIDSVTFTYVSFCIGLYLFVQLCLEVMSTEKKLFYSIRLFWRVIVIVTLGGAAIFTAALQIISICKEVLPLCFTFVTIGFTVLRKCL